jgi:serine/threonine-protein kinase HipA
MSSGQRSVLVYMDVGGPAMMGTLHAQIAGRQELFSFEYSPEWLRTETAFAFDPDLQLLEGSQYPAQSRNNFGIFLDSAPDRWGRLLMQRRENLRARQEVRKPRRLTEWDYLLGVPDETRLGALRLDRSRAGSFWIAHLEGRRWFDRRSARCCQNVARRGD